MKLYEIDARIAEIYEQAIDAETGEIINAEALEQLQELGLTKEQLIEETALYYINLEAELSEVQKQEQKFKKRRQVLNNKLKRIFERIQTSLDGKSYKSIRVNISYIKSKSLQVTSEVDFELFAIEHPEFAIAEITPDKTAIKQAIERGEKIPGCEIVEKQNMQIK